MKREDVKVNTQVIPEGCRYDLSTVVDLPDHGGYVLCRYPSGNSYEVHIDDLELYDPEIERAAIIEIQSQIDQSVNLFEVAFAMLQKARDTADSANLDIRYRDNFDVSKLNDVVDKNGWSSSSIWC